MRKLRNQSSPRNLTNLRVCYSSLSLLPCLYVWLSHPLPLICRRIVSVMSRSYCRVVRARNIGSYCCRVESREMGEGERQGNGGTARPRGARTEGRSQSTSCTGTLRRYTPSRRCQPLTSLLNHIFSKREAGRPGTSETPSFVSLPCLTPFRHKNEQLQVCARMAKEEKATRAFNSWELVSMLREKRRMMEEELATR